MKRVNAKQQCPFQGRYSIRIYLEEGMNSEESYLEHDFDLGTSTVRGCEMFWEISTAQGNRAYMCVYIYFFMYM